MPSVLSLFARRAPLPIETKEACASGVATPEDWLLEMFGALPANAGKPVTPATAMSVPTVKACVELIAGAMGTLPAHVYRNAEGGGRSPDLDHPSYPLVADEACPWQSASKLREQLTTDALLHGNGVARANVVEGRVVELNRLQPGAIGIETDPITGEPFYRATWTGGSEVLRHDHVLHVAAPCSLTGTSGVAPIHHAREAISLALALEAHAGRIFAKGGRPSGVIEFPKTITETAVKQLGRAFADMHAGERSGRTAVLVEGASFKPLTFSSVDLEFMALRDFQVREIAKAFNVPPTLVGELAKATLNNSETMGRQFVTFCLLPWVQAFTDAYRRLLIPATDRRTHSVGFDLDDLLRADSTAAAQLITALRSTGSATANDVRAMRGLPAMPGGDVLGSPFTASSNAPAGPTGSEAADD